MKSRMFVLFLLGMIIVPALSLFLVSANFQVVPSGSSLQDYFQNLELVPTQTELCQPTAIQIFDLLKISTCKFAVVISSSQTPTLKIIPVIFSQIDFIGASIWLLPRSVKVSY